MMNEDVSVQVHELTYHRKDKKIIHQVDMQVKQGDIWSVIGANGAGKTTLIRCLAGLIGEWEGQVLLNGRPLGGYASHERAKKIAYVPQSVGHTIPFSVYEFLLQSRYPYYRHSAPSPEDHRAVDEALETVGMSSFKERMMPTLSGGESQLILIAAALCPGPSLILLDEPITHLDYKHAGEVMRILKQLNKEKGISLVTVLHDINQVMMLGGNVMALKQGERVFSGPVDELMNRLDMLHSIYDVTFSVCRESERERMYLVADAAS